MSVSINDKSVELTSYDDEVSIIQKYATNVLNVPPEYISIVDEEYELEDGVEINVTDIRDELRGMDIKYLSEKGNLAVLRRTFPGMSAKEIGIVWLDQNYDLEDPLTEGDIEEIIPLLRNVDVRFANRTITKNQVLEYKKNFPAKLKKNKQEQREREQFAKRLNDIEGIETSKYNLEGITTVQTMQVPTGTSLEDIFDAFNMSEEIPYLHLSYGGKNLYKVYIHFTPPIEWIDESPGEGLHFKILNVSPNKLFGRKNISGMYSEGVWKTDNNVEINFSVSGRSENDIRNSFLNALENRLDYEILQESQLQVKGTFLVRNISFNKAVFADMVGNNEIMNKFLFFNERGGTPLNKDRFTFYYSVSEFTAMESLTITVTPQVTDEGEWIEVRISRASTLNQANSFRDIFSKFLRLYLDGFDQVVSEYKKYLPNAATLFSKYVKKPKKKVDDDKKTGKRLFDLKSRYPNVFVSGYATLCAQTKQPYILDPDKVQEFKNEYGDNKTMEFTDPISGKTDTYACEPREEGEESNFIYPGLRQNNRTANKDEVPFVPCCYTDDQYVKVGGWLYKQLHGAESEEIYRKERMNDVGHVLVPQKRVPRGRVGEVPFYLSFIVESAGYQEIERTGKNHLPILRYGVIEAPDSFIHCLEKAFNSKYSSMTRDQRIESVRKVRNRMSERNVAVVRQELYDYSEEDIRKMLRTEGNYLDPGCWVRMAETYYNCNIFIYQVDEEFPLGAVVIPRFSQAYLLRDISESKRTVFILKYEYKGEYPYQCELLVKFTESGKDKLSYSFKNDTLVEVATSVLYRANSVYMVSPDDVSFYSPVQFPDV